MTCGIYKLCFPNLENLPYVGQSQNIEARYIAHKSALRLGKSNDKLLNAYVLSNKAYPILTILEECDSLDNLDEKEVYWINKLNSITTGLNITDKVNNKGYGQDNFNSKYLNSSIEEGFLFICDNLHLSNRQLAISTGLTESVVCGILIGTTHKWLRDIYQEKYDSLINRTIKRTNSAKKQGITYPNVISPEGIIYSIDNLSEFARTYNLNKSSLHQVLTGKRKSCNKWKLSS